MTQKEVIRTEILIKISQKRLTQEQAAKELNLSIRQVQRIYKLYRKHGAIALVSKKRGKPSNNKLGKVMVARIGEIVTSELYIGFGPTFMCEKLEKLHNIKISRESTRQLMIQNDVWTTRKERRPRVHQQRQRRARCGELVQVDGSPHAWFEDRGEPCTLLVFIDDATGRTHGKFFEVETTAGYMLTTAEYIKKYGKPLALYSDKYGVFRVNKGDDTKRENFTQFGRAVKELEIDLIYANSPQAKGRVERANQTLQDRLIKEMRLSGISTIVEANKFLVTFWDEYNKKFAVSPRCKEDAHRKAVIDLDRILCEKHERVISKNLEFQFENVIYQIILEKPCRSLIRSIVTVLKKVDGSLSFEHQGKPLPVRKYAEQQASGPELEPKELEQYFKVKGKRKVSKYHSWQQEGRAEARRRAYQAC